MMIEERVFKALADATRRFLLDLLFKRDGRSQKELEQELAMTRFGVMKHLRVLEAAGLVVTRRSGRKKLHFLNAVPIRMIHDRWTRKYTEIWAATLIGLKKGLEETVEEVFEIYIKTTPQRLWKAITDPSLRRKYNFGVGVYSDWKIGSAYKAIAGDEKAGMTIFEGEILEINPPWRLVQTYRALWSDAVKSEGTSKVTWEIEQVRDSCRLQIIHSDLREGANTEICGGWPMILSGLKTLLETGKLLTTPGSLRFVDK